MAEYPLNHSHMSAEIDRLESMHRNLLVPIMGKTLLPDDASDHLKALVEERQASVPVVSVADIATGTGVWLADLASLLPPTARLDGYDFDTSKFRRAAERPPNVSLSFGNLLEPFPDHLHGQYDVVHVRLLVLALKPAEWKTATQNMLPLLRPGGYLVWDDFAMYSMRGKPEGSVMERTLERMVLFARADAAKEKEKEKETAATDDEPDPIDFPVGLDRLFAAAGLADAYQTLHPASAFWDDPQIFKATQMVWSKSVYSFYMGIVDAGGFQDIQNKEDAEEKAAAAKAEIDAGKGWADYHMWRTVGRQPLQ